MIYDNLEIGLEAFKKLIKLISRFPQYDLNDNLDKLYIGKENVHVEDVPDHGRLCERGMLLVVQTC